MMTSFAAQSATQLSERTTPWIRIANECNNCFNNNKPIFSSVLQKSAPRLASPHCVLAATKTALRQPAHRIRMFIYLPFGQCNSNAFFFLHSSASLFLVFGFLLLAMFCFVLFGCRGRCRCSCTFYFLSFPSILNFSFFIRILWCGRVIRPFHRDGLRSTIYAQRVWVLHSCP